MYAVLIMCILSDHTALYNMFQSCLWTMERNMDNDVDCQEEADNHVEAKIEKTGGKRRHSLSTTLNFLHLK